MQRHFKGKMWRKWWLFHATNCQSLMYPCFIFGRILGIFPYKINHSSLKASKVYYIISTVIVCIVCILNMLFAYNIIISNITLGSITKNIEVVCFYTFCSIIMIITHVLSGPRMRLLQIILKISLKLPPKSYQQLFRVIHIKDISSIIFTVIIIYVYFSKQQVYDILGSLVLSIYSPLLVFQINMLYTNCIYILKVCFKNINDNLAHMQRLVANNTKPCIPMLIHHQQRNQLLLIELKNLKGHHQRVSDAVKMLNTFFSLQLIATMILILSNITFELYFYIVRWHNGLRITFDKYLVDTFLCCIMYHGILITLLIWTCETCKNQAYQIRTTIHDLLNNTNDEEIKDELHLFSLQILHHKGIFSTKGFPVDATLLAAMVGSVTTYMLILIQFLIISHSCDKKSISHK
ncbi:PREDICTED: putative gustatory receptor 28a [Vollenhovia emeryi]|uniref:putative gustatory receptor 28a n=1 Tax=Vollenhovia emeryi TaxID=411798 RepID=UPI0005F3B63E|nr:PREDICTED: putative gustatory receptor 28a [Vollenhovia emeryi]